MEKDKKTRIMKVTFLGWLLFSACKFPDFISGLGDALGNMFRSFGP